MLGRGLLELLLLVAVLSTALSSSSSSTTSLAPFSALLLLLLELGCLFVSTLNGAKLVSLLPVLSGSLPSSSLAFPGKEHPFDDVSDRFRFIQLLWF